jgi:Domain of unknown function (DUF6458)
MRIGAALFLFAIGAILKFAVTDHVNSVDLGAIGVILMIVGIIGLALELVLWNTRRSSTVVTRAPGATYVERPVATTTTYVEDPVDRY